MNTIDLYWDLSSIVNKIPIDFGGGCPISKSLLMAKYALDNHLKTYVEIGVYRGRSFFPMARAMQLLGGVAYGIDPYLKEVAFEYDVSEQVKTKIDEFIESLDFDEMYTEVSSFRNNMGANLSSKIIRATSSDAVEYFRKNNISIDMLHIDGNHDTKCVLQDLKLYLPLVRAGGFIVLDDTDWDSVKPALNKAIIDKAKITFIDGTFAILQKNVEPVYPYPLKTIIDQKRSAISYFFIKNISTLLNAGSFTSSTLKVSVLVVTYNHEQYIGEAIESILAQQGDFKIEIIIADDFSADRTLEIIKGYLYYIQDNPRFEIKILNSDHNLGIERNYQRAIAACTGEYFAICEGDDYWLSPYKLQSQIDFMKSHEYCSFCFHNMYIYWQDSGVFNLFEDQTRQTDEFLSTKDIITNNLIGNFTVCLYKTSFAQNIPEHFYSLSFADWMFNIVYSQYGQIGHINECMSVYRKHKNGYWAGRPQLDGITILNRNIFEYNEFLDFDYDKEFSRIQQLYEISGCVNKELDLLVLDDFFPNPISGFRWQEYISYLNEFPSMNIATSAEGKIDFGEQESFRDVITEFKNSNRDFASKLIAYYPELKYNVKVVSVDFLNLAYKFIDHIERLAAPFVFTLYPGGTFQIDDQLSDEKLKRIFSSPCFRKVIVTQQLTYDYLIKKEFCTENQIEFIFGCVAPLKQFDVVNYEKNYFGYGKETLDICFVAHRYSEKGIQKGFDVFIEVAKLLCKIHPNIFFHVVGGYDDKIFDVSEIKSRISFYDVQKAEWFDKFYKNIDIILSPNIHSLKINGSFDGFPTLTCVEAGLRNTAIFCTDELQMNAGRFIDGEEIVIVPHNAEKIAQQIDTYYQNPSLLKEISTKGRQKIVQLYGYDAQILPRVRILKTEIENYEENKKAIFEKNKQDSTITVPAEEEVIVTQPSTGVFAKIKSIIKKPLKILNTNRDIKILRQSGLFDEKWYLAKYPDVAISRGDPYRHYLRFGAREGRNPSRFFNSQWYLDTNPDVRRSGANPLVHYLRYGRFEGRLPDKNL